MGSKIRCKIEEKREIYTFLESKYKLIREAYKHLACVSPLGNIPSIGINVIAEMTLKWPNFIDFKTMRNSDVDLAFITTNTTGNRMIPQKKGITVLNPERQLIRCQLMELLVRLAIDKNRQL